MTARSGDLNLCEECGLPLAGPVVEQPPLFPGDDVSYMHLKCKRRRSRNAIPDR